MTAQIRPLSLNSEVTGRLRQYAQHNGPYENTAIHAYVLACQARCARNVYEIISAQAAEGEHEVTLMYALPPGAREDLEMRGFCIEVTSIRTLGDERHVDGFITTISW